MHILRVQEKRFSPRLINTTPRFRTQRIFPFVVSPFGLRRVLALNFKYILFQSHFLFIKKKKKNAKEHRI